MRTLSSSSSVSLSHVLGDSKKRRKRTSTGCRKSLTIGRDMTAIHLEILLLAYAQSCLSVRILVFLCLHQQGTGTLHLLYIIPLWLSHDGLMIRIVTVVLGLFLACRHEPRRFRLSRGRNMNTAFSTAFSLLVTNCWWLFTELRVWRCLGGWAILIKWFRECVRKKSW